MIYFSNDYFFIFSVSLCVIPIICKLDVLEFSLLFFSPLFPLLCPHTVIWDISSILFSKLAVEFF